MNHLLQIDGHLVIQGGHLVSVDDPADCECCEPACACFDPVTLTLNTAINTTNIRALPDFQIAVATWPDATCGDTEEFWLHIYAVEYRNTGAEELIGSHLLTNVDGWEDNYQLIETIVDDKRNRPSATINVLKSVGLNEFLISRKYTGPSALPDLYYPYEGARIKIERKIILGASECSKDSAKIEIAAPNYATSAWQYWYDALGNDLGLDINPLNLPELTVTCTEVRKSYSVGHCDVVFREGDSRNLAPSVAYLSGGLSVLACASLVSTSLEGSSFSAYSDECISPPDTNCISSLDQVFYGDYNNDIFQVWDGVKITSLAWYQEGPTGTIPDGCDIGGSLCSKKTASRSFEVEFIPKVIIGLGANVHLKKYSTGVEVDTGGGCAWAWSDSSANTVDDDGASTDNIQNHGLPALYDPGCGSGFFGASQYAQDIAVTCSFVFPLLSDPEGDFQYVTGANWP